MHYVTCLTDNTMLCCNRRSILLTITNAFINNNSSPLPITEDETHHPMLFNDTKLRMAFKIHCYSVNSNTLFLHGTYSACKWNTRAYPSLYNLNGHMFHLSNHFKCFDDVLFQVSAFKLLVVLVRYKFYFI